MLQKLFLISFLILLKQCSACKNVFSCEHGGNFNNGTCACDCFPTYFGKQCELAYCDYEPLKCSTFSPDLCQSQELIRNYCPKLCSQTSLCRCGFDSCINGGLFLSSSCSCACPIGFTGFRCEDVVTTTTTTTTTKCATLNCHNGGRQNPSTCKCDCYPAYSGSLCENLNCTNEPLKCKDFSSEYCSDTFVSSYCPVLCGKCGSTSTYKITTTLIQSSTTESTISIAPVTTTTTLTCNKNCKFGTLNNKTCKCDCPSKHFSGELCEVYNCTSFTNDADICDILSCSDEDIAGYCPKKCLCTPTNNNNTTTCLSCYNGGTLDTINCACKCLSGFNGDRCQFSANPCNFDDPPECGELNCSSDDVLLKCQKKCICCDNLECNNLGELIKNYQTDKCECKCINDDLYDKDKNCEIKEGGICEDYGSCEIIYGPDNCDFFVSAICPKMCGKCTAQKNKILKSA